MLSSPGLSLVRWQLVKFERSATPELGRHVSKAIAKKSSPTKQGALKNKSKHEWKLAKEKFRLGAKQKIAEEDEAVVHADPEGNDSMYKPHATLPTFACVERFEVTGAPADFFILHKIESDVTYQFTPNFFAGKGTPSIDQKLSSLQMRGDLINLASVSAATGKISAFWDTISVIRQVRAPSYRASQVGLFKVTYVFAL